MTTARLFLPALLVSVLLPSAGLAASKQTSPQIQLCTYDADCPTDEVCDDDGYCTATCSADAHCREDWTCSEAGRCEPATCDGCLGGVRVDDIKAKARAELGCQTGSGPGSADWMFIALLLAAVGATSRRADPGS